MAEFFHQLVNKRGVLVIASLLTAQADTIRGEGYLNTGVAVGLQGLGYVQGPAPLKPFTAEKDFITNLGAFVYDVYGLFNR